MGEIAVRPFSAALLLAAALAGQSTRADETLRCTLHKSLRGGAFKDWELELVVDGDVVKSLQFFGGHASGKEGGGSVCGIEPDAEQTWTWTRKERLNVLTIKQGDRDRVYRVEVERTGNAYQVRFPDSQLQDFCGPASEFPKSVTIRPGKTKCSVVESRR